MEATHEGHQVSGETIGERERKGSWQDLMEAEQEDSEQDDEKDEMKVEEMSSSGNTRASDGEDAGDENSGPSHTAFEFDPLLADFNNLLTPHSSTLRHLLISLFTKSSRIPSQLQVRLAADGGEQVVIDTWSPRKNLQKRLDQSATTRFSLLCDREMVRLSKLPSSQLPYTRIKLKDLSAFSFLSKFGEWSVEAPITIRVRVLGAVVGLQEDEAKEEVGDMEAIDVLAFAGEEADGSARGGGGIGRMKTDQGRRPARIPKAVSVVSIFKLVYLPTN